MNSSQLELNENIIESTENDTENGTNPRQIDVETESEFDETASMRFSETGEERQERNRNRNHQNVIQIEEEEETENKQERQNKRGNDKEEAESEIMLDLEEVIEKLKENLHDKYLQRLFMAFPANFKDIIFDFLEYGPSGEIAPFFNRVYGDLIPEIAVLYALNGFGNDDDDDKEEKTKKFKDLKQAFRDLIDIMKFKGPLKWISHPLK